MATFVLQKEDTFAVGVSVGAYPKSNWRTHQLPPTGLPQGSATTSATVQADGKATLTGLADGTDYFAYAASPNRYISFRTARASSTENTLVEAKGDLLVGSADDALVRKAVGTDGQVLTADAASAGGMKWAASGAATRTYRLPILGWVRPDDTGDCYPEPFEVLATNDVWKRFVLRYGANNAAAPTQRAGVYGGFTVPKAYAANATLVIVWTATLLVGDVVWDFDYRTVGGNDTTSLDQAGTEEALTVTDTAPGAAFRRLEATIDLTDANFAADEEVEFFLARDGVDAADTLAGSALLFSAFFQYTDA